MKPILNIFLLSIGILACNMPGNMAYGMQQHIKGHFTAHPNTEIRLLSFDGFQTQVLDEAKLNDSGQFQVSYPDSYQGIGVLEIKGIGSLLLILSHESFQVSGTAIQDRENLHFEGSKENDLLKQYIQERKLRESKLNGWKGLKKIYEQEEEDSATLGLIKSEIHSLEKEEQDFLAAIPKDLYVAYYLPLRILVEERPISFQYYPERIPEHIADFKTEDMNSTAFWQSGLVRDFFEGHFRILEIYSPDECTQKMKADTDHILATMQEETRLLAVTEFLFKQFEKRSFFAVAEHLSLQMLEQNSCTVEGDLERRFEQYRAMKPGNVVANIDFTTTENSLKKGFTATQQDLFSIESDYKVVLFSKSECSFCEEELPKLVELYPSLKDRNIEVVSISLDTEPTKWEKTVQSHPWLSYCDLQKWEGPAVKDYYVFATPTFYLLDKDNKIVRKINSVAHLEAVLKQLKMM